MKLKKATHKMKTTLLPPSSRSFHSMAGRTNGQLEDVIGRLQHALEQLQHALEQLQEVRGQLEVQQKAIEDLTEQLAVHDAHMKVYGNVMYRQKEETPHDMRKRLFYNLPVADEPLRTFQLAMAKLLYKINELCDEHGMEYWLWAGSVIGAASCEGPIPWDDDIDIAMMREDAMKLYELLKDDEEYQITLVYDYFVCVKQFRFSHRNPNLPCFVDIVMFDWATDCGEEHEDKIKALREEMLEEYPAEKSGFEFWRRNPWIFALDSGFVVQAGETNTEEQDPVLREQEIKKIEDFFGKYQQKAIEKGIYCEKEKATAIAYGLENLSQDAPWRRFLWPVDMILPTQKQRYIKEMVNVPHQLDNFCDIAYPGWPYLPKDILGHNHFSRSLLQTKEVREELKKYVEE